MPRPKKKTDKPDIKLPAVRDTVKPPNSKADIDFKKLIKLRYYNGLSLQEISDMTDTPTSTLHCWFKPIDNLIKHPDELEIYKNNKSYFLESLEYELLTDLMDTQRRKRASLNNTAYAFQQIHVAGRLERGLSTGNLAINVEKSLTNAHEKAKKQRDKLSNSADS